MEGGELVSLLYGDRYASRAGADAQARHVFLAGCGLPAGWAGRRHFTLAELGFGTGRNLLCVVDWWSRTRPAGGRLHLFSVEAHPLPRALAREVLGAARIAPGLVAPLLDDWAERPGRHRRTWPGLGVTLDLGIGEALPMVEGWDGRADAWLLDGFHPRANPAMWSAELFAALTARSAPGARAASWCVAGDVRARLAGLGWSVERRPGLPPKRHRLEARLPGTAVDPGAPGGLLVVGAGVAGAAVARAARAAGARVRVLRGPPAASWGPRALLTPLPGRPLADEAFERARALVLADVPQAVAGHGVLRLARHARDAARLHTLVADDRVWLAPAQARARLGEPEGAAPWGGLWLERALVLQPALLLPVWLGDEGEAAEVLRLDARGSGWRLRTSHGPVDAERVVLAGGWSGGALWPGLGLEPRGGSLFHEHAPARGVSSGGLVVAPGGEGVVWGGTHHAGPAPPPLQDRAQALGRLARLRPRLAALLQSGGAPGSAWAAVRAHRPGGPVAGRLAPGLFALAGLGGRGFLWAPLLGEHVAAMALGLPSPLDRAQAGRFAPPGVPAPRPEQETS